VLVVETLGAPAPTRRRLRRAKPRDADEEAQLTVPVTRLTLVVAGEIEGDPEAWLGVMRTDETSRDELVDRALAAATRALAAQRVAAVDGTVADPSLAGALVVRVGFGDGDELVEGRWDQAIELPREARRRTRGEAIRPQERMAAYLGGRATPLACEELLIRARADVNGGRMREAALQLRVGLEALLAERDAFGQASQADDLGSLDGRRSITGEAANDALKGSLTEARAAEVAETLAVCERVLRRRAAHG
jgi:hypothetical protein